MEMDKWLIEFNKHIAPLLDELHKGKGDESVISVAIWDRFSTALTQVRRDAVEEAQLKGFDRAIEKLSDDSSQLATASINQGIKMCIEEAKGLLETYDSPEYINPVYKEGLIVGLTCCISHLQQLLTDKPAEKPNDKEG